METFPNEGKIDISLLDKDVIKKIVDYLKEDRVNLTTNKGEYKGISWHQTGWWYLLNHKAGSKPEYTYNQISKFIEPNEFKKGDYVILLKGSGKLAKKDFCVKQQCNSNYLRPEIDCTEFKKITYIWVEYKFNDNSNWRYATQQEVAEYNRISKPYDVTTLKSELTKKDLQKDVVYFAKHKEQPFKYLVKHGAPWFIGTHSKGFGSDFSDNYDSYTYQLATEEQIQHYNACVQVGKYVEPNTTKSLVGKYVKCITKCDYWTIDKYYQITEGDEFKARILMIESDNNPCYLSTSFDCFELMPVGFEPNTKINDYWCIGSYLVAMKDRCVGVSYFKKGDLAIIIDYKHIRLLSDDSKWSCTSALDNIEVKWFATKNEAEEFAKTLVGIKPEPTKVYDHEVVHCTTQEEWDFVRSKTFTMYSRDWEDAVRHYNGADICIQTDGKTWSSCNFYKSKNAKIYTFKEWCDMNNYTFESHKFEVGKWYKHFLYSGTYAKFQSIANDIFIGSEWITDKGVYKNEEFTSNIYSKAYLIDINEIQQYLPEGHVDKIKSEYVPQIDDWVVVIEGLSIDSIKFKNQCRKVKEISTSCIEVEGSTSGLHNGISKYHPCEFRKAQPYEIPVSDKFTKSELKKGIYYQITYFDSPGHFYIVIGNGGMYTLNCLDDNRKTYCETNQFSSINIQIQLASQEQIEWLDKCISANKFVPKELSKDELLEIAKSKYPVGTKVKCLVLYKTVEILSHDSQYTRDGNNICFKVKGNETKVYQDGKWAEIVDNVQHNGSSTTYTETLTITECKEKYSNVLKEFSDKRTSYKEYRSTSDTWIHEGAWDNSISKPEVELQLKGKVHLDTRINHIQSTSTNLYKKSKSIIFNNN